jgi:Glu-tRNA(Gln) amidotransferase subunit E-like FAD-binding protein
MLQLEQELKSNAYPGRGIVIGRSANGKYAVTAYFIMGRSANSRNRVFVTEGEGIRTQAFDPSKLEDPSLIIYAPVRVLGNKTIVTNGDQTDTIYEGMDKQLTFEQYVEEKGLKTVNDEGALRKVVEEVIAANSQSVEDYHNGKEKAIGFLVGQTMKAMKGKADPASVNQMLKELL